MKELQNANRCPYCHRSDLERVENTDGTLECARCGERTHAKIEANRDDLEALAASDNPAGELAKLLTEPSHE